MNTKTKALSVPVGPEVAAFAVLLETRLQMEGLDMEESWKDFTIQYLLRQIASKWQKMTSAKPDVDPHETFSLAVEIGCFAMMIAEKAATQATTPLEIQSAPKSMLRLLPNPKRKA